MVKKIFAVLKWKEIFLVIFLSLICVLISTSHFFFQSLHTPENHIFIGNIHYYEDMYYYIGQIERARQGAWQYSHFFGLQNFTLGFVYFNYILLGKVALLLNLPSFQIYNYSVLFLKLSYLIIAYLFLAIYLVPKHPLKRIGIFIIFIFSTSFPEIIFNAQGQLVLLQVEIFRAKNLMRTRFDNVPNTLLTSIYVLFTLMLIFSLREKLKPYLVQKEIKLKQIFSEKKEILINIFFLLVVILLLTISDPIKTFVFLFPYFVLFSYNLLHKRTNLLMFLIIFFCLIPSIYFVIKYTKIIDTTPIFQQAHLWDINAQETEIKNFIKDPLRLFLAFGTLGIASFVSILFLNFRSLDYRYKYIFLSLAVSLVGYFNPLFQLLNLPSFRFITSTSYLFLALLAFKGLEVIKNKSKIFTLQFLFFLYLVPNLISISVNMIYKYEGAKKLNHAIYLPVQFYEGFNYLKNIGTLDSLVLANPYTTIDLIVPAYTGKRVFSGHFLLIKDQQKRNNDIRFFLSGKIGQKRSQEYLKENGVNYVIWTSLDGDFNQFKNNHPYLKNIFQNNLMTIFSV